MLRIVTVDEPRHIDELIVRGGISAGRAAAALVALELRGLVRRVHGQRWIGVGPSAEAR